MHINILINKYTSTSFIIGTGLKKWIPPNRSKRVVETAMSAIGIEEVLLAKMVCLMENMQKFHYPTEQRKDEHVDLN